MRKLVLPLILLIGFVTTLCFSNPNPWENYDKKGKDKDKNPNWPHQPVVPELDNFGMIFMSGIFIFIATDRKFWLKRRN